MNKDFMNNLYIEQIILEHKIKRLEIFIHTEKFKELDHTEQLLLAKQREYMCGYLKILKSRIKYYENKYGVLK